jgi:hypothetical protein
MLKYFIWRIIFITKRVGARKMTKSFFFFGKKKREKRVKMSGSSLIGEPCPVVTV